MKIDFWDNDFQMNEVIIKNVFEERFKINSCNEANK